MGNPRIFIIDFDLDNESLLRRHEQAFGVSKFDDCEVLETVIPGHTDEVPEIEIDEII